MWPKEHVELKRIDELLTCGICYEYMDTCVTTLCSHNYCSLCIRKYLHYKTQCPTCSEETFEKDLRKNKILDEIIVQYLNFKEKFGKKCHPEQMEDVANTNLEVACSLNGFECEKKIDDISEMLLEGSSSPVLATSISTSHGQQNYEQDVSNPSTSTAYRIPLMFTPKSRKTLENVENCKVVACPVCKVEVSQNNINKHLDDCLKRENAKNTPKKIELKRKPLPKLVLSLMKDGVIRKKLKELGLSSQGDRKTLENRLQKYIILYNAECDKINPRPTSELIKQYEEEENLEKKTQKSSNRLNVNRNTEQNIIEQQRKKYLAANKDSFEQLIAKIKNTDNTQKFPVRRNIFSKENLEISYKDLVIEDSSTSKDSERSDFLPLNPINYIDDSNSNMSCPLQMYSSENPMNFLTIELSSSSDDETDQCAVTSNHDTSNPRKTNSLSFNSIVKTEDIKTESLSLDICKEVASNNLSSDTTNRMDVDTKESLSELIESESKKKAKLSAKRYKNGTSQEQCVTNSESRDRWERGLCNTAVDSIEVIKDIECAITDTNGVENRFDYEKTRYEQLYDVKNEYTSGPTKLEKENVETLDENINILRKRERDMTFMLNEEEKIEDRSMNNRKSARLGLSEANGFNNENFDENTFQNEEILRNEKKQSRITRASSINHSMKRSIRLRSKVNNNTKNNES